MKWQPVRQSKKQIRGRCNPRFFNVERITASREQIELAFVIRNFRRINNLSQEEMANLCTLYGKHLNVKFGAPDISTYENYVHAPTEPKFQVLMDVMHFDPTKL